MAKYYFQDLDENTKYKIFTNVRKVQISNEKTDDFINRHNWARTRADWLKLRGLVD